LANELASPPSITTSHRPPFQTLNSNFLEHPIKIIDIEGKKNLIPYWAPTVSSSATKPQLASLFWFAQASGDVP